MEWLLNILHFQYVCVYPEIHWDTKHAIKIYFTFGMNNFDTNK